MRVLLVSDFFPPVRGGLEAHVDVLAAALAKRGHEVHVATMTADAASSSPLVHLHRVSTASARLISYLDARRPFHPPVVDPLARRGLRRIVDLVRPDVVHGHSWLATSLPPLGSTPLLFTAHDYALVCAIRTLLLQNGETCLGPSHACWACAVAHQGLVKGAALTASTPIGRRRLHISRLIAVSQPVREALQAHLSVDVDVISNFLPDEADDPSGEQLALPAHPYVLYAGDPSWHKGLDLLLELWAGPDPPPATLLIASTKAVNRPLPPNSSAIQLHPSDVSTVCSRASAVVVPSRWQDPCPTVALQALRAGTPVIAAEVGGLKGMFHDGQHGYFVPPGDVRAMAHRIRALLADPVRASSMGEAASRWANRFTASVVLPQIETAYRKALGWEERDGVDDRDEGAGPHLG